MRNSRLPTDVLALVPSKGCGGGIEAYTRGVLGAVEATGIRVLELPLSESHIRLTRWRKASYLLDVVRRSFSLRSRDVEVICFHPGLITVGLAARVVLGRSTPVTAFFYGADIWGAGPIARRVREFRPIRRVAISSFSAGALSDGGTPLLLPPAVDEKLHKQLLDLSRPPAMKSGLKVLSVFRLADYVAKGGPELVEAVEAL